MRKFVALALGFGLALVIGLSACGGGGGGSSSSPGGGTTPQPVTDPATVFPFPISIQKLATDGSAERHLWPKGDWYPASRPGTNRVIVKLNSRHGDVLECSVFSKQPLPVGGGTYYYLSAGSLTVAASPQIRTRARAPASEQVAESHHVDLAGIADYGMIEMEFARYGAQTAVGGQYQCYNFSLTVPAADLPRATLTLFSQGS